MAQIILDSNNNLIQGDFDNATVNNRTKFKTTTLNGTTNVYAVPNGSSTSAGYSVSNAADPTNASKITIATNGATDTQIISGINGSGSYLPMSFYTNNALAAQLTTAGNLTVTGSVTATGGFVQGATAAPAFSAYLSANQAIANETSTKIAFDVESFDTNNNFASSRFTPTVAGYYQISGATRVSASATGEFFIAITKNGTGVYRGMNSNFASANALVGLTVSGLLYLNGSTDYVEMFVYQGTGSSKNITGDSAITWMTGFLARSA